MRKTMTLDNDGSQAFSQWMQAVDATVESRAGVSVHDLPDCCFRDWFEDETPPATAARRALTEAGLYM